MTAFILNCCYLNITNIMNKEQIIDSKVMIDGEEYFTKIDFAIITEKHQSAISKLIHKGNRFRKLKAKRLGNYVYVKASELTDFPHVPNGRAGQGEHVQPYYYDNNGDIIPSGI